MLFYLSSSPFLLRSNVFFLSSILVLEFKYFQIPNLLKITIHCLLFQHWYCLNHRLHRRALIPNPRDL